MLTTLYSPGNTVVHRARPMRKVLLLLVTCTLLFVWESWVALLTIGSILGGLFHRADLSPDDAIDSIRPVVWFLVMIFAVQTYLIDWQSASFIVLRFIVMILAASLLTLTTRTSDLIDAIESALRHILPEKMSEAISLAFSLCLRFIPLVRRTFEEVREAQQARGLGRSWRALVTPTIVRTLKSADEIAQAITVRSIDTRHLSATAKKAEHGRE